MTEAHFDAAACVAQVLAGDDDAFRHLVDRTYPLVAKIVRAYLPPSCDRAAAEQEAYLRCFERLGQFRHDAPLEHWLSRIAVSVCLDALRKRGRTKELRHADLSEAESAALDAALAVRGTDRRPDAVAARELLTHVFGQLPPEDTLLLTMHELEERTLAETAELMGWRLSWTKLKLSRARGRLKAALERLGER